MARSSDFQSRVYPQTMAVLSMPLLYLVAAVCGGIPRSGNNNFPLDDCSTGEIDFLFLYYNVTFYYSNYNQKHWAYYFANEFLAYNGTAGRVQFAEVFDTFLLKETQVNVSSWSFKESIQQLDIDDWGGKRRLYPNINRTIQSKTQFVKRLFAEMGGVRKNATHVAVVFLDGLDLSFVESRSIPDIVQQQDTDIKIFVVVLGARSEINGVYVRDTLIVGYNNGWPNRHILMMALCNRCPEGGFLFKPINPTVTLSCYFLYAPDAGDVWSKCLYSQASKTATVETEEELHFLQKILSAYLKEHKRPRLGSNGTSMYSARIAIGLERDTQSLAKRFHWENVFLQPKHRALVVNHWLSGEPSGGSKKGCGSWQFDWNGTNYSGTSLADDGDGSVDGWVSVGCEELSNDFRLCEASLPLRDEFKTKLRIKPATTESFNQAFAKGHLRTFKGNLVSVSANVGNDDFRNQVVNESFPLFDCGVGIPDSRYISYLFVCDGVDHCINKRDEMLCAVRSQSTSKNHLLPQKCIGINCCDGFCLPLQWVNDGEVDCEVCGAGGEKVGNDEAKIINNYLKKNESCAFICNDDQCVLFSQLNNSIVDCKGPEGPLDETLGKLERADTCQNILGHPIWAPRCVYVRDRYEAVLGCRDMSHLKGCTDFVCPEGYMKCPNTYCIPQHYVLDGTADCPEGEDEDNNNIVPCTGNFACWDSTMCLHPDLVCDGHPDCPHQDDEVDCHVTCPEGLRCISGTVTVLDYRQPLKFPDVDKFDKRSRYFNMSRVELPFKQLEYGIQYDILVSLFMNVTSLILSHCRISDIGYFLFYYTTSLQDLDLSYNLLRNLENIDSKPENIRFLNLSYNKELVDVNMFSTKLKWLETLDLSHTSVFQLEETFLASFPSLRHLNLSFTKITSIHKHTFPSRRILLTLNLRGLALTDFREHFFNGLTVSQDLFTDSFELCCPQVRGPNIPGHACHAPDKAISSCYDLVGVDVQRVLLWVVAVFAVLGNMTVIVYRVIWDRSALRTCYGLFVTNLGISDFIMGVYLFIIAGADYYYSGVYVLSDKSWKDSYCCSIAGFLATLSYETSTFFVFLITLDRFLVMKFPFGEIQFDEVAKNVAVVMSWVIGFLLALIPIVFRFEIYSSNAMCLGLPLTTEQLNGWEFSFAVFIVLNFCLFLLIAYGQRAIFRAMSENRQSQTASRRVQDITVAKQLSLVALSNFLCWFPVILLGLLSLGGHEISNGVYAWMTVIVLPINTAANPILYTIPALMAKWERFKHGET